MGSKKDNKVIGNLGEDIAAKYLKSRGLKTIERNYLRKWGEIDIIACSKAVTQETSAKEYFEKQAITGDGPKEIVHFVEVKSVSYETKSLLDWAVTHETWRPEELVHQFKLNQIRKAVETWVIENSWGGEIQLDVISVRMVPHEKYAVVKYIPNVIIE